MAVTRVELSIFEKSKAEDPPPATPQDTWTATTGIQKTLGAGKAACM